MSRPTAGYRPSGRKPIPVRLLYARLATPVQPGRLVLQHRTAALAAASADSARRPGRFGVSPLPTFGQPSRFLVDRAEAERAFALAEQLGSVNAAAAELGTTWPSLRKAFTRHGLGMPARNPEAVRKRAIAAARHRSGQPAPPATPPMDSMFVTLNRGQLPAPRGPRPEQGVRLRRAEEIETLSYRTVVALNQESRLAPRWRIATIARRAERAQRLAGDRTGRPRPHGLRSDARIGGTSLLTTAGGGARDVPLRSFAGGVRWRLAVTVGHMQEDRADRHIDSPLPLRNGGGPGEVEARPDGPATAPQPAYRTRVRDGKVEVRLAHA